jgi:hypothetical protein
LAYLGQPGCQPVVCIGLECKIFSLQHIRNDEKGREERRREKKGENEKQGEKGTVREVHQFLGLSGIKNSSSVASITNMGIVSSLFLR